MNRTYRGKTSRVGWTHEADILSGQRIDAEMVRGKLDDAARTILVADKDPAKVKRVTEAMLKMVKLDIAPLEKAAQG